ncbi:MAG: NADH-quinone oxidoreductase subunit NuoH [Planctomycetes bacterium]|nr:NADH-quinone oxidoreductase subunit NuoH [Planctomycetota bacterium]
MQDVPELVIWIAKIVLIFGGMIATAAIMSLAERKVSAWMQYRYGPNRVGPFGLLQPLADGVKFIFKEELIPAGANKLLFRLAPALAAMPSMLTIAVIPIGTTAVIGGREIPLGIAQLDIGIMYMLAIGGLGVYGVILGGWASNSKYSMLGGLRAAAQMISYELTLILSILAIVALSGSLDLNEIVASQREIGDWNICTPMGVLAFVLFTIASFAETNRHPFDFAECEPELVGGFHTEYSAMRFALYFIGEYCAMTVMSSLNATLFFGGPSVPFMPDAHWALGVLAFLIKAGFFLFLFIWVRWTLPRLRFDQLMRLGWRVMLPLALFNLLATGAWIAFTGDH